MNYYAVVFLLRPPNLVRRGPFFERKNVCNSQENGVHTRRAAIVNHPAVLKRLRVVNLLRIVFLVRRGPLGGGGGIGARVACHYQGQQAPSRNDHSRAEGAVFQRCSECCRYCRCGDGKPVCSGATCYCCGNGKQLQAQKEEIINLTQKRLFPLLTKRLKRDSKVTF